MPRRDRATTLEYQGQPLDFSARFTRMTLRESILHYNPAIEPEQLDDLEAIRRLAQTLGVEVKPDSEQASCKWTYSKKPSKTN